MQSTMIQQTQLRLAHHYLKKLQQANTAITQSGKAGKGHWLNTLQQDWAQIKQWQAWSAIGEANEANKEQARLCVNFVLTSIEVLQIQQTPAEQLLWMQMGLQAVRQLQDTSVENELLYRLGFQCLKLEQLDEAERYAHQLMTQAQSTHDDIGIGRAWFILADAYNRRGEYEDAKSCYIKSQALLKAQPHSEEIAETWAGLARIEFFSGNYEGAYDYALKHLEIGKAMNSDRIMGIAHLSLSGISNYTKETEQAAYHAQQALIMARHSGALRLIAHSLIGLAHAERQLNKLEDARDLYEEAIAMPPSTLPPSSLANALFGLAQTHFRMGDNTLALHHYERSIAVAQDQNHLYFRVCDAANASVNICVLQGNLTSARHYLAIAIENALKVDTPPYLAATLYSAAQVWQKSDLSEQAIVWMGLLSDYIQYLDEAAFHALCERLAQEQGEDRYTQAVEASQPLTLNAVLQEISNQLSDKTIQKGADR